MKILLFCDHHGCLEGSPQNRQISSTFERNKQFENPPELDKITDEPSFVRQQLHLLLQSDPSFELVCYSSETSKGDS